MIPTPVLNPQWLPTTALYGDGEALGWQLAPTPFVLTPPQQRQLVDLGGHLWRFQQACDRLYRDSHAQKNGVPGWIAALLDQGKPPELLAYGQMKRFRGHVPLVLRPDLLITAGGFALSELDAVPGGLGFTAALNAAYRHSGFAVLEAPEGGLPALFARMLGALHPGRPEASIAIVMSDEASDYRAEMQWLCEQLRAGGTHIALIHPRQVRMVRETLVCQDDRGLETPIDTIYRFFELFDLPNIPHMELIRFAVKKGRVACTPPFKPHLEEKLWLALTHHPCLQAHWRALLGRDTWDALQAIIPQGWVLDPAPLPPQAILPGLTLNGQPLQAFSALSQASQAERHLVIKPSGFSPLAWGSRGVSIGHDLSASLWGERLEQALRAYGTTPHVLQAYHKPMAHPALRLDLASGNIEAFSGRTRLCPYYIAVPDGSETPPVTLAGVLATTCPADKKIIHGMADAVLAPCHVTGATV